ncbi:MAG: leucyl/phenylalanyl-tRNA---protein transferase [Frankiales bacterium]|nr:leucyl/phenylalanyl-tRNA---protein transferase [Frankiales bacterium]
MSPTGHLFDVMDVAAQPRELVALGGRLDPETLRAAYRNGVFPWPAGLEDERRQDRSLRRLARRGEVPLLPGTPEGPLVPWVSPHPRAVVATRTVRVPRSLRQLIGRTGWETTLDADFEHVIAACADRESTWITPGMIAGYTALHREGGAHSIEVWQGRRLVGGLYGVLSGRVFSGESMFFVESGASKAAVVDLCRRLAEVDVPILDTQQESEHLRVMGQVLVHRTEYVTVARSLQGPSPALPTERRLLVG